MWDEEQFFKDFVSQTEKVQPDQAFIDKMAALAKESSSAKIVKFKTAKVLIPVAAAACALLVFGVNNLSLRNTDNSNSEINQMAENSVDTEESTDEFSNILGQDNLAAGNATNKDYMSDDGNNLRVLERALADNSLELSADGKDISEEALINIKNMISNAVICEKPENMEIVEIYTTKNDMDLIIEIGKYNYFVIINGDVTEYYHY